MNNLADEKEKIWMRKVYNLYLNQIKNIRPGMKCEFLKAYTWTIHLLFYDLSDLKFECHWRSKCPITLVLLVTWRHLAFIWTAISRGFKVFNCVSGFLFLCSCVCTDMLFSVALNHRNEIGKCQVIPLTKSLARPLLWNSCLHWAWCCFFDLLGFKTNSNRTQTLYADVFGCWLEPVDLWDYKINKWGLFTYSWLFI